MRSQHGESWMSPLPRDPEAKDAEPEVPDIDTSVAHSARRYDYWLGGKDNFAADSASGDAIAAAFPTVRTAVIENRRWVRRAAAFLAEREGVRQFLDIGTGIPTSPNVHEIVQGIAPDSRVVYVDNDPIVLAHARALLASTPEGATAYIDADLRDPEKILGQSRAAPGPRLLQAGGADPGRDLSLHQGRGRPVRDRRPADRRPAEGQLPCHVARHQRLPHPRKGRRDRGGQVRPVLRQERG